MRLAVESLPARYARRLAARHRQRVQIAYQVEDDGPPVGRHIEREPGALVRRELEGLGRRQREVALRTSRRGIVLPALRGGETGQRENEQRRGARGNSE